MSRIGESMETESKLVVARRLGEKGRLESDSLMGTGFLFGVMRRFWKLVVVAQHCECT